MNVPAIGHQDEYEVRTYEIDSHKTMTIPALVRLMQEAAMQNVIRMGLSVWDLESRHLSWVLMRMQLLVEQLPVLGQEIQILTYPSGFERIFTYRDFRVLSATGVPLAAASSKWLLMNTESRRMSAIPDFILEYRKKMPTPGECLPRPEGKVPRFGEASFTKSFEVNWHDLDFNEHLNNTLYIQWMLEPLPWPRLGERKLKELDIDYRAECQWREHVRAEVQEVDDGQYLHRLVRTEDGKELAAARTVWSDSLIR